MLKIKAVPVLPEGYNVIIGQTHFIKSVEDIYEALASSGISIRFGLAFCESSGPALIRHDGNDDGLIEEAIRIATSIGAGHCFVVTLRDAFPINVLNRIKSVEEVVGVFCATANPVQVIVAQTEQGNGILGVIDGVSPKGVETEENAKERKDLLRKMGYKR
jgi:adenosine/AMP kinase